MTERLPEGSHITQKILIVDDRSENLFALRKVLRATGTEVIEASSGNDALKAVLRHDFSLAILDVQMPDMDGYELAELIRGEARTALLPIIFLSAVYTDETHVFRGYESGAVDFIVKPYNQVHLLCKVRVFLDLDREKVTSIRASEERLRGFMNSAADGFVLFDSDLRLREINPPFLQLFPDETTRQDLLGKTPEGLKPVFGEGDQELLHRVLETGEAKLVEDLVVSAERGERHLVLKIFRVGLGLGVIGTDITERKRAEVEIRQLNEQLEERVQERTQELAGANRELRLAKAAAEAASLAKSEFLANMSHEIRTPMTGVLGMLDLIQSTELGERQRGYVDMARSSADLLLVVINDILDFSKIEAGKLELEEVDFDLRGVVENATLPLAQRAAARGVELACFIPTDVPTALRGDPVRLAQVLTNLLGNAVKFTQAGEVVVEVHATSAEDALVDLRFEVRDTGVGIDPAALKELFQPFTQADSSTSRRFGGTGLGLTISRRLVELMGGEIGVESVRGEGSTFWFTCAFAPGKPQPLPRGDLSGRRMLSVDDSATNRQIMEHYLAGWGVRASTAASGPEALRLLLDAQAQADPFEVALLDQKMPGMDGLSLARAIRGEQSLAEIQLVLLSSLGLAQEESKGLGIVAHLVKPIRREQLHERLQRAVGGREPPAALLPRQTLLLRGHVLLVDDMLVNQVVGQEMLRQLGLGVEVANGGREAIRRIEGRRYDVVLMDCQMPDLDGFETTRRIRGSEAERGRGDPLPIVAITANALEGDREVCLEAGMDGYISKPFDRAALSAELARWLPQQERQSQGNGKEDRPLLDFEKLDALRQTLGPRFETVLGHFRVEGADLIVSLRAAATAGDTKAMAHGAHALKGVAGNLFASALVRLSRDLEHQARAGVVEAPEPLVEQIASALEQVLEALS